MPNVDMLSVVGPVKLVKCGRAQLNFFKRWQRGEWFQVYSDKVFKFSTKLQQQKTFSLLLPLLNCRERKQAGKDSRGLHYKTLTAVINTATHFHPSLISMSKAGVVEPTLVKGTVRLRWQAH